MIIKPITTGILRDRIVAPIFGPSADGGAPAPVAWYSMDEASGATRLDGVGSVDLTDTGTVNAIAGKVSNAADFANGDWLSSTSASTLAGKTTGFSLACWVKIDTLSGNDTIYICADGTAWADHSYDLILWWDNPNYRFRFRCSNESGNDTVNLDTTATLATGTWYFVYVEYNPTTEELGISVNDGAMDTIAGPSIDGLGVTPDVGTASNFYVGTRLGSLNHLDGQVDELAKFDAPLPEAIRTSMYAGGSGISLSQYLAL